MPLGAGVRAARERDFGRPVAEVVGGATFRSAAAACNAFIAERGEGFDWLSRLAHWGVGACLADDMGLGKTLQALALILTARPGGPSLVVAPTPSATNWLAEAARFAPTLKVRTVRARRPRRDPRTDAGQFDVVVASYGLLQLEAALFAASAGTRSCWTRPRPIKNAATRPFRRP